MATGFLVCTAPDSHIDFLQEHQGSVHFYLDGTFPPELRSSQSVPEWWPQARPKMLDSWNVNYRNTDLYHWILNGKPELVSGPGSIFQSWHAPAHPAVHVKLDKHNERFALCSEHIEGLSLLASRVNVGAVLDAFTEWCKSQGKEWRNLDHQACEPFVEEFVALGNLLAEALQRKQGIIW
jgi:hypothetical protein